MLYPHCLRAHQTSATRTQIDVGKWQNIDRHYRGFVNLKAEGQLNEAEVHIKKYCKETNYFSKEKN